MNIKSFANVLRLNSIAAICLPSAVSAMSPWSVTDGTELHVTESYISTAEKDYPLFATGEHSKIITDKSLSFSSTGDGVDSAFAKDGAELRLNGVTLNTSGESAHGVNLDRGELTFSDGKIITTGANSSAISGINGSKITINNSSINANYSGMNNGIEINGSEFSAKELVVNHSGSGSGLTIDNSGSAVLDDVSVSATNDKSYAGILLGTGKLEANKLTVNSSGRNGFYIYNATDNLSGSAKLTDSKILATNGNGFAVYNGTAELNNVNVETLGAKMGSYAVNANTNAKITIDAGSYITNASYSDALIVMDDSSNINAKNTAITTYGDNSIAMNVKSGQGSIEKSTVETYGNGSYGIYSESSASTNNVSIITKGSSSPGLVAAMSGTITAVNNKITTMGNNSSGLFNFPGSKIEGDQLTINTYGENAYGLTSYASTTDLKNSQITTSGKNATGIYAYGYSTTLKNKVSFDNVSLDVADAAAVVAQGTFLDLDLKNGTAISAGEGKNFLEGISANDVSGEDGKSFDSTVNVDATDNVTINGNIYAAENNIVNLSLNNNSLFNGAMLNGNSVSVDESSKWNVTGNSDAASIQNGGIISFDSAAGAGTVLKVHNNYVGNSGVLVFNTVLTDDKSATNKMIVEGDTSGTTHVAVNNLGGKGAYTKEQGIEIVHVDGQSEGDFIQQGRIVAGTYDYKLGRGNGADQKNWFLTNSEPVVEPSENPGESGIPGISVDPSSPPVVSPPVQPATPSPKTLLVRPEAGAYIANQDAANNMFLTGLKDRLGEVNFINSPQGSDTTSLWLRQVGGHARFHDNTGQLNTQSNRYVAQLGGDIAQWGGNGNGRLHLGLMAGYGNSSSNSFSKVTSYHAKGQVDGYSLGAYGTWYANDRDADKSYIDTWVLYNWFNNHVNGEGLDSESYKSNGVTASVETAYAFKMGSFLGSAGGRNNWYVQPVIQIIWMGIKPDEHFESNGTHISSNNNSLQTRLGVRTYLEGASKMDEGLNKTFEPFIETNWIHNTKKPGVMMDNQSVYQAGSENVAEIKLGVEGKLNSNFSGWTNVAQKIGEKGYSDTSFMAGLNIHF